MTVYVCFWDDPDGYGPPDAAFTTEAAAQDYCARHHDDVAGTEYRYEALAVDLPV